MKQNQCLDPSYPRMTEKLPWEGRERFPDLKALPGRLKPVLSLPCYTSHCYLWVARVQLSLPSAKLLSSETFFLADLRLRHKVVYIYIYMYTIVIGMCLCKDGEELPLFTLPLRSFAKHALQMWSYKASISISGKWSHCNSLLLLLDGVISHRLNIRIDWSHSQICIEAG